MAASVTVLRGLAPQGMVTRGTSLRRSGRKQVNILAFKQNGVDAKGPAATELPSSHKNTDYWTTNTGTRVWNNDESLTIGERGPVLLEDHHLLEKLGNFHREKIPERSVHARGAAAKGYFEVTNDVSSLTCAKFLQQVGGKTPVIARFSTVVHERGSPESLRDVRGFSIKFYTEEGNWDFVGNDIPVFFIRDGLKFVDIVHALRPNPKTNIQEGWRIMDFFSHVPESMHMFTFLLDDNGVPYNYRTMPGFGVHTFKFVNSEGKETFVKFHWLPKGGERYMTEEEKMHFQGTNHSHATEDLFQSIKKGEYPEWTLFIQTMDPAQENDFDFDPLDATTVWPEESFPLQPVGRLVLDQNIDNFFNQNEMLAFSPAVTVPGIAHSDDKLLQSRVMSYSDAQRYRLGGNYLQLPVNAPKCPFHNNHYDGLMNFVQRDEEVNYFPSNFDAARNAEYVPMPQTTYEGKREKTKIPKVNDFKQAGDRVRSWDDARRGRYVHNLTKWLLEENVTDAIRKTWVEYQSQVDAQLGDEVAQVLKEAGKF